MQMKLCICMLCWLSIQISVRVIRHVHSIEYDGLRRIGVVCVDV